MATSPGVAEGPAMLAGVSGTSPFFIPGAITRTLPVDAGTTQFHLNCDGNPALSVVSPSIAAMFFPNRY